MSKKKKITMPIYTYYNPNKSKETRDLLKSVIVQMLLNNKINYDYINNHS